MLSPKGAEDELKKKNTQKAVQNTTDLNITAELKVSDLITTRERGNKTEKQEGREGKARRGEEGTVVVVGGAEEDQVRNDGEQEGGSRQRRGKVLFEVRVMLRGRCNLSVSEG